MLKTPALYEIDLTGCLAEMPVYTELNDIMQYQRKHSKQFEIILFRPAFER